MRIKTIANKKGSGIEVKIFSTAIFAAAAAFVFLSLSPGPASGQEERSTKAPTGPTPRTASGKPDFSGVWQSPRMADVTENTGCCKGVKELPYTAWGKARWESYDASKGDYAGSCLPFGLLRSVGGPHPIQLVQNDKYIAML